MHICLFDIDGTLISSAGAGKAALEASLAAAFGVPEISDQLQLAGRTDRAICRDLFRFHDIPDTPENTRRLIDGYLQHLPTCLVRNEGRVLPGVAALLQQLAARTDVLVGLLTGNVRAGARVKLSHFGLFDHFAFGGFGDDHFDRDDVAREAFEAVQRRLGDRPPRDRVWVIGDTPLDIQCARAIGARAVAVATGWHTTTQLAASAPDLLFEDLSDPAALLERWN
jgi:phosphoglycolate phosphatase-like HAD superfamily hydrolase